MTLTRFAIMLLVLVVSVIDASSSEPFQLSLTPSVALHNRDAYVEGLSLGAWGDNPRSGIALGIVNGASGNSSGFSLALLLNYSENYQGAQWTLGINHSSGQMLGWQLGLFNLADGKLKGLQTGAFNWTHSLEGVQLGLVNCAAEVQSGIQIGVINLIRENDAWFSDMPTSLAPGMVIVNWRR